MAVDDEHQSEPRLAGTANIVGLVVGVTMAVIVSTLVIVGIVTYIKKRKVAAPTTIDNPAYEPNA